MKHEHQRNEEPHQLVRKWALMRQLLVMKVSYASRQVMKAWKGTKIVMQENRQGL